MSDLDGREAFIDLVYETAVDPAVWPAVLARLAGMMGGHAAALRSYELLGETGVVIAAGVDAATMHANFREFADRNPLKSTPDQLRRKLTGRTRYVPGTKMDVEWLPKDDFVRTDYYNQVYRPFDIHSDISIGLAARRFVWTGVDVYRPQRPGPFSAEDLGVCHAIHPHLVRALSLGRRLTQSQAVTQGLEGVFRGSPHGLFLVEQDGFIRYLNDVGRAFLAERGGLTSIAGRLACADHQASLRLGGLMAQAGSAGPDGRSGGAMALATPERLLPLSIMVAPIRAELADPFLPGPAVVVCVTDLEAKVDLPVERLRTLFDLTPAEVRVALALFEGAEPSQVARRLELAMPTVRTHMAHIFQKTGVTGQVELARLMMRLLGAAGAA